MENRAKSDPKWIGKRIEKMIKTNASGRRLGRFWVEKFMGGEGDARNPGPPKALKSKKITKTLKLKLLVNSRKHD